MAMTWKQIEASRERRLWCTQVGIPLIGLGMMYLSNPQPVNDAVEKIADNAKQTWNKFTEKVKGAR
jgi:hypothetical protein